MSQKLDIGSNVIKFIIHVYIMKFVYCFGHLRGRLTIQIIEGGLPSMRNEKGRLIVN